MIEKKAHLPCILFAQIIFIYGIFCTFLQSSFHAKAEAVLYDLKPATYTQYSIPYQWLYNTGYSDLYSRQSPIYSKRTPFHGEHILQIEPSDAIDDLKYSQPDITPDLFSLNMKVPLTTHSIQKIIQSSAQDSSPIDFQEQTFSNIHSQEKPMRDMGYLNSENGHLSPVSVATDNSNFKMENDTENNRQSSHDIVATNLYIQSKNNITNSSDDLVSVSSDTVLNYEVPFDTYNESTLKNSSVKETFEIISDVPSPNASLNNNSYSYTESPKMISEYITPNLATVVNIDLINQTNQTEYVTSNIFPPVFSEDNITKSLPSTDSEKLTSGTVAGIVIAVLVTVTLISSAVIYLLYRRFNGRCTSVVESKFNTDNCGYLDDSLRSSIYLNNHIELPKESSEEMTSLDNDSFLNSLETMTIQNYWADNSKNTKV